jgi:hypothetical protein
MSRGTCVIANDDCRAPAGYRTGGGGVAVGTVTVRTTCFRCGEHVCTSPSCSKLQVVRSMLPSGAFQKKRARICFNCNEELLRAFSPPESKPKKLRPEDPYLEIDELKSGLGWLYRNFQAVLAKKPVRDLDECFERARLLLERPLE